MDQPGSDRSLEAVNEKAQALSLLETPDPEASTQSAASTVQHAESKEAIFEEAKGRVDAMAFGLFLTLISGENVDHPWISQLGDVGSGAMDPRELLRVCVEDPDSLILRSRKKSKRCWRPNLHYSSGIDKNVSKIAALRALVGSKKWENNPKLQEALKGTHVLDTEEGLWEDR